jgi:ABC-type transport system substrate-binding protein
MVLKYSASLFVLFLLLFSCSDTARAPQRVDIGVWGTWEENAIIELDDYKAQMLFVPLYFRYFIHRDPDLGVVREIRQLGDTVTFHLHPDLRWHDGSEIIASDIWTFLQDNDLSFSLLPEGEDKLSLRAVMSSLEKLEAISLSPFKRPVSALGNGVYRVAINQPSHLQLTLADSLSGEFPRTLNVVFFTDIGHILNAPDSMTYDLLLQIPISDVKKITSLRRFIVNQRPGFSQTALFLNPRQLARADELAERLDATIDRHILTDALLWGYGEASYDLIDALPPPDKSRRTTWPDWPDEVTVLTNNNPLRLALLRQISLQAGRSGLTLRIESSDWSTYKQRLRAGNFGAAFVEHSYNSPTDFREIWELNTDYSASRLTGRPALPAQTLSLNGFARVKNRPLNKKQEEINSLVRGQYPVVFLYRQNFIYLTAIDWQIESGPQAWFENLREWQKVDTHDN